MVVAIGEFKKKKDGESRDLGGIFPARSVVKR